MGTAKHQYHHERTPSNQRNSAQTITGHNNVSHHTTSHLNQGQTGQRRKNDALRFTRAHSKSEDDIISSCFILPYVTTLLLYILRNTRTLTTIIKKHTHPLFLLYPTLRYSPSSSYSYDTIRYELTHPRRHTYPLTNDIGIRYF